MTKEQLLSNKSKLEKGVNNPNLTDSQKELAKKRLAEIEAKLANLEKEKEEPAKESEASKEPAKEPAKKSDKPKAKKKPKDHKEAFKSDCQETVSQIRLLLDGHNKKKVARPAKPATKKRTSEVLSDGICSVAGRAIKRELTLDKVVKIKVERLEAARDHFVEALIDMRASLGGIASDNQGFIQDFKKQFNDWIAEVKEKQKKADEPAKQAA